jgi:acyl carrier protein
MELDLREKIKAVFVKSFEIPAENIQDDKLLFDDLGLDSLDLVDLIVGLQKEFKLDLRRHSEIQTIRTFGDVCKVMEQIVRQEQENTGKARQ